MKGVRILLSCMLFALTINVEAQSQEQQQSYIVKVVAGKDMILIPGLISGGRLVF